MDDDAPPHGQARFGGTALFTLTRAAEALLTTRRVDTLPLVDTYRELRPAGHPGAAAPELDLLFLRTVWGLGGPALLRTGRLVVVEEAPRVPPRAVVVGGGVELHVPPSVEAGADGLSLALGLTLESAKVRRALGDGGDGSVGLELGARLLATSAEALAAAFGSYEGAEEALEALRRAPASRQVHLAPPLPAEPDLDDEELPFAPGCPLFVVAGATERLHDLLSPYVRRLGPKLDELVGPAEADDGRYEALTWLFAEDSGCHEERVTVERTDGLLPFGPGALAVRTADLDPGLVDPRCEAEVRRLARADAVIVLVGRHPNALARVLDRAGPLARMVAVVGEALVAAGAAVEPDVLAHASGSVLPVGHGFGLVSDDAPPRSALHVPSLGLSPLSPLGMMSDTVCTALAWPLMREIALARVRSAIRRNTRTALALVSPSSRDASEVALHALARMATGVAGSETHSRPRTVKAPGARAGDPARR